MPESPLYRRRLLLTAAFLAVAAMGALSVAKIRDLISPQLSAPGATWYVAQDDQESEGDEVSADQVEKYVNVYQAMQRDRTITVEQAASRQHLSVEQFRDIESRIERDGVLRERVRRELLKTAQEKSNALKLKPQSVPSGSRP
jgi:hypothetical protein